ncbi:MAG TPA: hypothetical protein VK457_11120 [Chloroflexota bacterium]|jgi:hypothetical protein|nr:hypothetical protein [Chloroflexota bacterium]
MADEGPQAVWVKDREGNLRGMHASCARWLQLEPEVTDRAPYHTEICRGCGRFLDAVPPEREGTAGIDAKELLL